VGAKLKIASRSKGGEELYPGGVSQGEKNRSLFGKKFSNRDIIRTLTHPNSLRRNELGCVSDREIRRKFFI
jgi:hypothetical protein